MASRSPILMEKSVLVSKNFDNPSYPQLSDNFNAWYEQAYKLREGQISKEEYDEWRYHYSMKDSSSMTASVNSTH